MNSNRLLILYFSLLLFVLGLTACGPVTPVPTYTPTISPSPSQTPTSTRAPTKTLTPRPTQTPTATSYPTLTQLGTLGQGTVPQIIYSPDGQRAFMSNGYTVRVLSTGDYNEITSFEISDDGYGWIGPVSPDGKAILSHSFYGFAILDIETQEKIGRGYGGMGSTSGEVFTPNGRYVIYKRNDRSSGGPYHAICLSEIGQLNLYLEYENEDCYPTIQNWRYSIMTKPAVSPDGKLVAAGYRESTKNILFIWDLERKTILHQVEELPSQLNSVAFSPDGATLATAGDDGLIRLWDPATGKIKRSIAAFTNDVVSVDFTPDGRSLHVYIYEQPAVLYGLDTGRFTPVTPPPPDPLTQKLLGEGYLLSGGGSKIRFSPDGSTLAVGHGNIQVWDVKSQALKATLFADSDLQIAGMTYSPDGNHLAIITLEGDAHVWDIRSGQREFFVSSSTLMDVQVLYAAGGSGIGPGIGSSAYGEQGIAFSTDSSRVALPNGLSVEIWDIQTARKTLTLAPTSPLMFPGKISYSADGRYIYAALNRNRDLAVWDAASGALLRQLKLPRVDPNAFTATELHGPLFARNNYDDENQWIELWNADTGQMIKILTHTRGVDPLRFSADGRFFSAIFNRNQLYIWRVDTGQLVFVSEPKLDIGDFAINSNGNLLATSAYGKVTLYDFGQYASAAFQPGFTPASMPPTPTPWGSSLNYSTATPQPTQMVTALPKPGLPSGAVSRTNADQIMMTASLGEGAVNHVAWSKDGVFVNSARGFYRLNPQNFRETASFQSGQLSVTSSQALADGRTLVAGFTLAGKIQVWDAGSDSLIFEREGWGQPALSPDGKWLVFEETDEGLVAWNLEIAQKGITLLSSYYLSSPVFSPNSQFVAAIQSDRSIRVWDVQTGVIVNGVGGPEGKITEMSFSPDGNYLLGAAGGSAWVWSMAPSLLPFKIEIYQGEEDYNLTLFRHTVTAIAANADTSLLAIGTSERKILFYNRRTGQQAGTLDALSGIPVKLLFSPDNTSLLSVDADGRMSLWDVASRKLVITEHRFSGEVNGLVSRLDGNFSVWMKNAVWTFDPAGTLVQAAYIPADNVLAASPAGDLVAGYTPLQVSLYDAQTGQLLQTLPEEAEDVLVEHYWEGDIIRQFYGALFSPDGKRLVTFGTGGAWMYTADGKPVSHLEGHNTRKAAFSADGEWLVTTHFEHAGNPKLYQFENASPIFSFGTRARDYFQYAISPDKRWVGLVGQSWDQPNRLELVSTSTGQVTKTLEFEASLPLSLAFNPTSTLVAIGLSDGGIVLVDVDTLEVLTTIQAHAGPVTWLIFSRDGLQLVSAGPDGVIKIWSVP
jgi:WD40 repeat protein